MEAREREAIANLQHLTNLKLLHPPRSREQIQRWQAMLSEAVALLKLLSAAKTTPSNTPDAAATVVRAQGLSAAASQGKPDGLLHGVPQDDRKRREVWRELSSHVHRLLVLLDKEVGVVLVIDLLLHESLGTVRAVWRYASQSAGVSCQADQDQLAVLASHYLHALWDRTITVPAMS
jgi:hypothetical protein